LLGGLVASGWFAKGIVTGKYATSLECTLENTPQSSRSQGDPALPNVAPALRDRLAPGIAPWDRSRNSSKRIHLLYNASMMLSDTVGPCRPRCRPCLDTLDDVTPRDYNPARSHKCGNPTSHLWAFFGRVAFNGALGCGHALVWETACSVEGVSHTEVVQAPHVPPHTALELPMVQ
jgi:hypothetical protein